MNQAIFWFGAAGLFYVYLGYPIVVWLAARLRPKAVAKAPFGGSFSVVISAFNEAGALPRKIASLLSAEDADRIAEIVVGSDGSTDGTADVVRGQGDPRVRVMEFPGRRGKPSVLNDLVPRCVTDVVVLTDARQEIHSGALRALLANFGDPAVGVVSGELVFRGGDGSATARGLGAYWRYEKFIRRHEAVSGSVPGATGALYAIRKQAFSPIPADCILDDVAIPMLVMSRGYRCVFEADAVVYDRPSQTPAQESLRKRRTIAGNAQLAGLFPRWCVPGGHPAWFRFLSHKVLRLASPFLLLAVLASTLLMPPAGLWVWIMLAQVLFYGCAMAGWLAQRGKVRLGLLSIPFVFVSLNWVTLAAWLDAVRGRYRVAWRTR